MFKIENQMLNKPVYKILNNIVYRTTFERLPLSNSKAAFKVLSFEGMFRYVVLQKYCFKTDLLQDFYC